MRAALRRSIRATAKLPLNGPALPWGAEVAVVGVLSAYEPDPFVFIMKDGEVAAILSSNGGAATPR